VKSGFDVRFALYFAVVVEERSFTQAAKRLGITQPAVSEAIAKLEHQLGFALFLRSSRRVELTRKGEAFVRVCNDLSAANIAAQELARSIKQGSHERLRLGAPIYSVGIPEWWALIECFLSRYPKIGLEVVHGRKPDLLQQVDAGDIDFALLAKPFNAEGLSEILVHVGVGHVLVPVEDPLSQAEGVRRSDLAGRSVVVPSRASDPETFDAYFAPFAKNGATLLIGPEPVDQALERFARVKRALHVRFCLGRGRRRAFGDMVRLPVLDTPLVLEHFLLGREKAWGPAAKTFWKMAQAMFAVPEAVEASVYTHSTLSHRHSC